MEVNQSLNEVPIYKGFLYRISDSAGMERGHLAGSVHVVVDPNYTLHPLMEAACQKAAAVFVELNLLMLNEMQDLILNGYPYESTESKILRMADRNKKDIYQLETLEFQKELGEKIDAEAALTDSSGEKKDLTSMIIRSLIFGDQEIQESDLTEADRTGVFFCKGPSKKSHKRI